MSPRPEPTPAASGVDANRTPVERVRDLAAGPFPIEMEMKVDGELAVAFQICRTLQPGDLGRTLSAHAMLRHQLLEELAWYGAPCGDWPGALVTLLSDVIADAGLIWEGDRWVPDLPAAAA